MGYPTINMPGHPWFNVGPTLDVIASGAAGDGVTDDTASIQAALNAGGSAKNPVVVKLNQNFNFLISAPLVINSNTILDARGATITLKAGSNCNMLKNAGQAVQRQFADANLTNGSTTMTSLTANFTSADVGQTISIANGLANSQYLTTTIVAVNSSTNVTLADAAGANVVNGTCFIYYRDTNIEVWGGTWNRGNNGGSASFGNHSITFFHVDNLYLHDYTANCSNKGYLTFLCDVTNLRVENYYPNSTSSNGDGLHMQGPISRAYIKNIVGNTRDDMFAMSCYDPGVTLAHAGNIKGVVVEGLFANGAASIFKIYGGNSLTVRDVHVRGLYGNTNGFNIAPINIIDDSNQTCDVSDVTLEGINVQNSDATNPAVVAIECSQGGKITIRDINYRQTVQDLIFVATHAGLGATAYVRNLIVDGVNLETGNNMNIVNVYQGTVDSMDVSRVYIKSGATGRIIAQNTGSIGNLHVHEVQAYFTGSNSNPIVDAETTITYLQMNNIFLNNGGRLLVTGSNATAMQFDANNITCNNAYELALIRTTVDMNLSNLNIQSLIQTALLNLVSSNAIISVRGRGLINPNNITAFQRDGTQTPRMVHPEMQCDISQLAANNGDEAYNTNGALGNGVGRCISNGTKFKNFYTGSTN